LIVQARSTRLRDVVLDIACRLAFVGLVILVASVVLPLSFVRSLGGGMIHLGAKFADQAKKKAAEVSLPRLSFFSKARKA
jgi:hypothetical protein